MTRRRKVILASAGGVLALAALLAVLTRDGLPVTVAEIRRDTLSVAVEEQGRTRARGRYTVAAPVTGRLSRTDVEEGDAVAAGEALVSLAPPPEDPRAREMARAELAAAEARLRGAETELSEARSAREQAVREAERRRRLLEEGAVPRETVERFEQAAVAARARVESAEASLRAARAEVEAARSRLLGGDAEAPAGNAVAVRAPAAGTVLRVLEESERVVQAGTPLFEIAGAEGLEVVVDLLTEDAVRVTPGDPMRVTGWGGEGVLEGRVRQVEPSAFTEVSALGVEEQRVNVVGDLATTPPSLGEGYRVVAAIVVWSGRDVLVVPTGALFREAGEWRTFVVEDGRARPRAVRLGRRGVERAQVLGGLDEGERVVVYPSDDVADGVRVDPEPSEEPDPGS